MIQERDLLDLKLRHGDPMTALLLLIACAPAEPLLMADDDDGGGLPTPPMTTTAATTTTSPTSAPTTSTDAVESVGAGPDDPAGYLFSLDAVQWLEISLSDAAIASLNADPYTFVPADITIDGHTLEQVGLRLKGRLGSYRSLSGKSGFKIELDTFVQGQGLFDLEHLNVNNMVQDSAQLHDHMAYWLYDAIGLPAPRVGYLWVTVNDVEYGLYANVEEYDSRFVQMRFGDDSGNLYDGDYWLYSDWSSYILIDFSQSQQEYFDLDLGEDVGLADIRQITAAIDATCGTDGFDDAIGAVVDVDAFARFTAVEAWVGQYDGYTYYTNNYRVYFDPTDGLATLMPWDHDWSFYPSVPITSPYGRLASCCRADATCHARMTAALSLICETVSTGEMMDELNRTRDLIRPWVLADPRRERSEETIFSEQEAVASWITGRCDSLAASYPDY